MKTLPCQPTGRKVKPEIRKLMADIIAAERNLRDARNTLRRAMEDCPHENVIKWTNNDGDGQFIVERCEDCGLQEDGGIRRRN